MSKGYLDRNQQNNTDQNTTDVSQKKIDPVAQLKWINSQHGDHGFGIYGDSQPAQMFTQEEEKQTLHKPGKDLFQEKEMLIKHNLSLEKEADVMDVKAAQGNGDAYSTEDIIIFGDKSKNFTLQENVGINGNARYRGNIQIKESNGRRYVEGFAEVQQINDGTDIKWWANLKVYNNGNSAGYSNFLMQNQIGEYFYDGSWKQIGYGRIWLPESGQIQVQINIGHNTLGVFNSNTINIIYTETFDIQ